MSYDPLAQTHHKQSDFKLRIYDANWTIIDDDILSKSLIDMAPFEIFNSNKFGMPINRKISEFTFADDLNSLTLSVLMTLHKSTTNVVLVSMEEDKKTISRMIVFTNTGFQDLCVGKYRLSHAGICTFAISMYGLEDGVLIRNETQLANFINERKSKKVNNDN